MRLVQIKNASKSATERKSTEIKLGDEPGSVKAVFATMNVVDKDGDITVPGAFGNQNVVISAYGHESWDGALPVGAGRIYEAGNEAIFEGKFFLTSTIGKDHYETIKALQEAGQPSEWSYGFDKEEWGYIDYEGRQVRQLRKNLVYEVSPVLVGAGQNTRTLAMKGLQYADQAGALLADADAFLERTKALAALRLKEGRVLSSANRSRIESVVGGMKTVIADLESLLTETAPSTDDGKGLASQLALLKMQYDALKG